MFDYRARLTRAYDGDSFWALLDVGGGIRWEPELRLLGVSAPELNEPGGPETRDFVNDWFERRDPRREWPLHVATTPTKKFEPTEKRSFARYLATVWHFHGDPLVAPYDPAASLNEAIDAFLARHPEWGGGSGAQVAS